MTKRIVNIDSNDKPIFKDHSAFEDLFCELFVNQPHKKPSKLDDKHQNLDSDCQGVTKDKYRTMTSEIPNAESAAEEIAGDASEIHLDEKPAKKLSKVAPPIQEEVFTSTKHSMDYFTVNGVILRTGYSNKRDWYLLPIREILDNSIDFLWKYYKGSDNASISVEICKDDKLFHLKIRNSNQKNIPVFQNLEPIFDFDMRYGSKQDVHIISRGMLGDALKQILSLGYVLIHAEDDGSAFENKQWEYPLIIRHNGREYKVFLNVDKAQQIGKVRIDPSSGKLTHTDTEIELVLPIIDAVNGLLTRDYIEQFCRKYSLFTTDISFSFRIIDDGTPLPTSEEEELDCDIQSKLISILSTVPEKGILNVDLPALHPITTEWNNTESIHSCKPEEFISRIMNVHDKESTSVWKVLISYKEGTQIKLTLENSVSIAELLSYSDKDKKIEAFYHELKNTLEASKTLSPPYTTNPKKRKDILVSRISKIYDIDEDEEASYKLVTGFCDDTGLKNIWSGNSDGTKHYTTEQGKGLVKFPFAIEILAVPLKNPLDKDTEFIGAVNYSVSPINNNFKGDYSNANYPYEIESINDIIRQTGFNKYNTKNTRLPCVILCNLITPRRDPHGYDKSSLDVQPFADTIVKAVVKVASSIRTYRAAGYRFQSATDFHHARHHDTDRRTTAREIVRQFLVKERDLPR